MKIYQLLNQKSTLAFIEKSLKKNEHIGNTNGIVIVDGEVACADATVIVDDKGNMTGWINNNVPHPIIATE